MKFNYDPAQLSKKQRHLKKWIPNGIYCDGCPFWHIVKEPKRNRKDCCYDEYCENNCSICDEIVAYCSFLNYIEYGPYPLGDGVKVCGIKDKDWRWW